MKMHWNSAVGIESARYATADAKNFYLDTSLEHFEHIKMSIDLIPEAIVQQCGSESKACKGHVCCHIECGAHGLPQAGTLVSQLLRKMLAKKGHCEAMYAPGPQQHFSYLTNFSLCVDNFGAKHEVQGHVGHLLGTLNKHCEMSGD